MSDMRPAPTDPATGSPLLTKAVADATYKAKGVYYSGRPDLVGQTPNALGIPDYNVMASGAPTVTANTGAVSSLITAPLSVDISTQPYRITVKGAHLSRTIDASFSRPDNVTPVDSSQFLPYWVEFYCDSPTFEVIIRQSGGNYRLIVDDKLVSATPTAVPSGGAQQRLTIDWTGGTGTGGRLLRKYVIECEIIPLFGFTIGTIDTLTATLPKGPRALIVGDSYVEGTGATARFMNVGSRLCQLMGWAEPWVSGSGGTGYLKTNGSRVKYRDRWLHDGGQYTPDVVVVTGGRNDNGSFTSTAVGTEALLLFQDIRANLPNALLIVLGPWAALTSEVASLQPFATAIQAAQAQVSNSLFIDTLTVPPIAGTGKVGTTTGVGNSDVMISSDGVHPTQSGHDLLARHAAAAIAAQFATT